MALRFRCRGGHDWEDVFNEPTLVDGRIPCPQCGQASEPTDEVTIEHASALLPASAQGTALRPPSPSQASPGHHATIVRPHLAAAPAHDRTDADGEPPTWTAPVSPSRQLDRRPEWPEVPGYEILSELGRGGMGVVYKARHLALGRVVALKMILGGSQAAERDRARFHTEAKAIARLVHPNIVQIHEVGEYRGTAWFSLEFVDGGSLADRLDNEPFTVVEAARFIEILARAMHVAHEQGIIHRDLKPANVLLSRRADSTGDRLLDSWTPKITDFGLAKTLDSDIHHTRSGMVVGTPSYMSPEQAQGKHKVGPETDVYALGVLLFELLTGRLPFLGPTPMDIMLKVATEEPPAPTTLMPRLPHDLSTICLKCLEKAPARRYRGALELAEDLRRFLAHEPILARPITRGERLRRWVRRRPVVAVTLALLFLGALVALGARGWYEGEERQRRRKAHQEVSATLSGAEHAAQRGEWENVRGLMAGVRTRLREDEDLAEYEDRVNELFEQAHGRLEARSTLSAFERARTAALFQATLSLGLPTVAGLARTRQRVEGALATVGASGKKLPSGTAGMTARERATVHQGCYELLLVLAEVTARPAPGMTPRQTKEAAAEAVAILDLAATRAGKTHAWHLRRARYLEQQGKTADAEREKRLARRKPADSALDHFLIGNDRYLVGDAEGASASFAESLRREPDHFWARYFLALCQVRLGQPLAARDNLTGCLSRQPGVVWIYLLRGFVNGQRGDYRAAEADYRAAGGLLQTGRANRTALYVLYNNRAVTRLGQKKWDDAEEDLRRAIALDPGQYQARVTLAQVYQQRGKTGEARRMLDRAIDTARSLAAKKELDAGTLVLLYRQRYKSAVQAGRTKDALADLDRIVALATGGRSEAHAQRDRGHLLYRDGKYKEALAAYDAALKGAADGDVRRWRAEVLLRLKRDREAIAAFDDYLAQGGVGNVSVYRGRALARVRLKEYQSALSDFTLAVGVAPKDAALRVQRGQVYLSCQAFKLAAADFEEALRLEPKKAAAHHGLALAWLHLGRLPEAAAQAEELVKHGPRDARTALDAACILAQVGGQMEPDAARPRTRARTQRAKYRDRAVALLQLALERTPAGERPAFWRRLSDGTSLLPVADHPTWRNLERLYGANR